MRRPRGSLLASAPAVRAEDAPSLQKQLDALKQQIEDQRYTTDAILKKLDDVGAILRAVEKYWPAQ